MTRRLYTLAAAVSLVLCLATVGFWVRSYFVTDQLAYRTRAGEHTHVSRCFLQSANGSVAFYRYSIEFAPPRIVKGMGGWSYMTGRGRGDPLDSLKGSGDYWYGFGYRNELMSVQGTKLGRFALAAPHWALTAIFLPLPVARVVQHLRRKRRAAHACPTCGYDLRATPDRCPECGKVPEPATTALGNVCARGRWKRDLV